MQYIDQRGSALDRTPRQVRPVTQTGRRGEHVPPAPLLIERPISIPPTAGLEVRLDWSDYRIRTFATPPKGICFSCGSRPAVTVITDEPGGGTESKNANLLREMELSEMLDVPTHFGPYTRSDHRSLHMNVGRTFRVSSMTMGLLIVASLVLAAEVASARTETLRWTHPVPQDLARFEAFIGTSSGAYGAPSSLGLPQADGQGVFSATIEVADEADVYIAIRAVDNAGLTSSLSNERIRIAPGSGGSGDTSGGLSTGTEIPANLDALVRFDFNSNAAADWFDTAAENSMSQDDRLFTVFSIGSNPALTTQSASTNIHSHFVGDPSAFRNIVLTGRMAVGNSGGAVGVTAYSQYPSADVYYRLRSTGGGGNFSLSGHPDSCSGNADTGVPLQVDVWYEFELTISNEGVANRISASVWKQGAPKPGSPQAECVDSSTSRPLAGTVGVWAMGTGTKYWDDLEVVALPGTTGGSGPPEPPVLLRVEPAAQ
jgi:hypothetical protein